MKLVLKDKQEIAISFMSNVYSFEPFKDGDGVPLESNSSIALFVNDDNIDFKQIKEKLTSENLTGFKLINDNDYEKTFDGYKISTITEEITDEKHSISIGVVEE